ncbi:MAG: DUF2207 domain-containing protein [Acidobacteriota bacterium]
MLSRTWLKFANLLVFAALVVPPALLRARSLRLERFHADIQVHPDGAIDVTETIEARFTGSWNGLYRLIPVDYRSPGGFSYKLNLALEAATDAEGRPLRYQTSRSGQMMRFKVWIPGARDTTKRLVLRYRVKRALRFLEQYDEFYWNVTGTGWAVPILSASAHISLPDGVTGLRAVAFTGAYGSTEGAATVEVGKGVDIQTTRSLKMREGLSISVVWDPGLVHRPGRIERTYHFLADNWIFALPILVFVGMFGLWHKRGRDPRRNPVIVNYKPPQDMTPAELGTLVDNSPDMRDITATLVDLAVRGFLLIKEEDKEQLLGLWSSREYSFQRLKSEDEWKSLRAHERKLLETLFSEGESVELSDLKNRFYKSLPDIRDDIFNALMDRKCYTRRPDQVKKIYIITAAMLLALAIVAGVPLAQQLGQTPLTVVLAGLLTAFSVALFGWLMPARTARGARFQEQILGFEEFLDRVESERFKRMITGPEMFEKFLPFAMALGVEKQWADAFSDLCRQPPSWYQGAGPGAFQTRAFVGSLNQMSTQTAAAMASAPRSSGGSGFSGGGSSGGGFGGGGGGGF